MEFESLLSVADKLINSKKKVSLLYAFNGTGKTRLSMEFIDKVNYDNSDKVLYFNAFTEDLFSWDNELNILKIDFNSKFAIILRDSGKYNEIIEKFQYYTSSKIEPNINMNTGEIKFDIPTGDENGVSDIKISRGEESVFIWAMFYVLVEEIIDGYNETEENEIIENDSEIEYVFIDDPISSLDDSHLISVGLDIANLLKSSKSNALRFIITTHHPLFYNVLHNEMKTADKYVFKKLDNKYVLDEQKGDSPFAYHLEIKKVLEIAIGEDIIQKYHFTLLRNLLEKTATFLGYPKWSDCILEKNKNAYARIINLYSHNSHSNDEYKEPTEQEKAVFTHVFETFIDKFQWYKGDANEQ